MARPRLQSLGQDAPQSPIPLPPSPPAPPPLPLRDADSRCRCRGLYTRTYGRGELMTKYVRLTRLCIQSFVITRTSTACPCSARVCGIWVGLLGARCLSAVLSTTWGHAAFLERLCYYNSASFLQRGLQIGHDFSMIAVRGERNDRCSPILTFRCRGNCRKWNLEAGQDQIWKETFQLGMFLNTRIF